MNNEIKLRNVQVILFFNNEVLYNTLDLANDILNKLPQLEQPNIFNIPNNVPIEIRIQSPKIIFNNSKDINLTITALNACLNMQGENTTEEIINIVDLLYSSLDSKKIQVNSMGVISDYVCFDINFEIVKNNYYKDELVNSELVNSSWFNKIEKLNIWKYLNSDYQNDKKILNIVCDVNNRDNKDIIDVQNINEIIKNAKEISEEFKNKIKRELGV